MKFNNRTSAPVLGIARQLPKNIWALGLVSMFMDLSSELVHSLLPIYMASVLGSSMLTIGVVEGIAEAIASISKVFSGALSDYFGKRKPLMLLGYGLSAATKPIFPMASSIISVAAARFVDRVGKGVRGSPRDALIADITPAHLRGAAYGLRQALDSVGAVLGPVAAIISMALLQDVKTVFWVAVVPAVIAVTLLATVVKEPEQPVSSTGATQTRLRDVARLGSDFWLIVVLGAIFTLARFSEAFLILRAQSVGMSIVFVPIVMVAMNVAYSGLAYPAGRASDSVSYRTMLLSGLIVLILADLILATATSSATVVLGATLWGLHMALTQGLFSKLVADTAPADLRGSAFGVFSLVTGISVLLASAIAGALWHSWGPSATFFAGSIFAAAAAIGLAFVRRGESFR